MSVGKCLSIATGLISAAAMSGVLWYAREQGWLVSQVEFSVLLGIGCGVGLLLSVMHYVVASRLDAGLRKLIARVESLKKADAKVDVFHSRLGLSALSEAIDHAMGGLRKQVEQLNLQRRDLEVQLRIGSAERQHLESILNSIGDGVIVTDAFNEIALCNEAAGRILHFNRAESEHQPVEQMVSDPTLVKLIKDTREGGDLSLRRRVEHQRENGGHASTYDVTLACLANAQENSNEPAGVVTILHDITREKEIAEMKSDFVSNVSHELRTPLSSIKAYMEMLIDGEARDDETRSEFYNIIQGETNRLSRLIDNILNISRIESGVVKVQREHIQLLNVIKEAIEVMQPQARSKDIELVEIETPVFFQVYADKDMVYQATLNLIGNAIKYTLDGGKVSVAVSVDEHDRMVNVSITDTGVGIPADDLPHLFDKFYRVADHKKVAKGTGLGLNLVKHIVETVHSGKVTVTSEEKKGSTFTFSLPLADQAAAA